MSEDITGKTVSSQVVGSKGFILVEFWAEWCNPCKKLAPILEEISEEFDIPLYKVNSDDEIQSSIEYGISSIPATLVFVDGSLEYQFIGAKPKHKILEDLYNLGLPKKETL